MGAAMSLFSYLNASSSSTSSSFATSSSSVYASALEQLTSAKASLDASSGKSSSSKTGVIISASASIAAATKADAKKEPAALVTDIRTALDSQYKTKGKAKVDLSDMSPRAVATIALNSTGAFSKAEVLTARAEMRTRDRAAFFEITANDFSASSLETYQNSRVTGYSAMSAEERAYRGAKG